MLSTGIEAEQCTPRSSPHEFQPDDATEAHSITRSVVVGEHGEGSASARHADLLEMDAASTQEVVDSDDEERARELARMDEERYWKELEELDRDEELGTLGGGGRRDSETSQAEAAVNARAADAVLGSSEARKQAAMPGLDGDPPERARSSSPDPMDLIDGRTQHYAGSALSSRPNLLPPKASTAVVVSSAARAIQLVSDPAPQARRRDSREHGAALKAFDGNERTMSVSGSPGHRRKRSSGSISQSSDIDMELPSLSQLLGRTTCPPRLLEGSEPQSASSSSPLRSEAAPTSRTSIAVNSPVAATSSSSSPARDFAVQKGIQRHPHVATPHAHTFEHRVQENEQTEEHVVAGRQLRKRTIAQLKPYQTEFAKYVSVAKRNQWDGIIIPAGLNLHRDRDESESERAARLEKQKRKPVHTRGGWLEIDDQTVGQPVVSSTSDASLPSSDGEEQDEDDEDDSQDSSSSRRHGSRRTFKGKERARADTSAAKDEDAGISFARPIKGPRTQSSHKRKRAGYNPDANVYSNATSSRVTLEEALADMQAKTEKRKRKRESKNRSIGHAAAAGEARTVPSRRADSEPPSSSPRIRQHRTLVRASSVAAPAKHDAQRKRSAPHTAMSRQSPRKASAAGGENGTIETGRVGSAQIRRFAVISSDSEEARSGGSESAAEDENSDSDDAVGDSPERPFYADDKFNLKGSRKRAAFATMPKIFLKRAIKDLDLMRKEKREGKHVREVLDEAEEDEDSGKQDQAEDRARARVRINKRNANKPIRFVVEVSTDDDADSVGANEPDSEEERDAQAAAAWANAAVEFARPTRDESHRTPRAQPGQGKTYWNNVIDNILNRDKLERRATGSKPDDLIAKRRRRKSRQTSTASRRDREQADAGRQANAGRTRQKELRDYSMHVPAVDLDDTDSLFSALPKAGRNSMRKGERVSNGTASASVQVQSASPSSTRSCELLDSTSATFSRFSYDFDINLLPAGLSFPQTSYLGRGWLHDLLQERNDDPSTSAVKFCIVFGIRMDSEMSAQDLLEMMPRVCEEIYREYTTAEQPPSLSSQSGQALHFFNHYEHSKTRTEGDDRAFAGITELLNSLETRIDGWMAQEEEKGISKTSDLLTFRWYAVERAYRTRSNSRADADALEDLGQRVDDLVGLLIFAGPGRTVKALKRLASAELDVAGAEDGPSTMTVQDTPCEIWVCLQHLFNDNPNEIGGSGGLALEQSRFWQMVENHLAKDASSRQLHPILAGEVASYTTMALCMISQFSIHGFTLRQPRLSPHWPVLAGIVDQIKAPDLAKNYDSTMTRTSRIRVGRYIWALIARVLTLSCRWRWRLADQSRLLGKIFDILNARELQDFAPDGPSEFPRFLTDYVPPLSTNIEADDTVFRLFLRLLVKVAEEAASPEANNPKIRDAVSRLTMRIMPMRQRIPYPRKSAPSTRSKDRSVLLNHYSLFILLAAIDPSSSERRFPRFKALLDFSDAHAKARQDCLRAVLYLGIVYARHGIDLTPLLAWVAELATYAKEQYATLAGQRLKLRKQPLVDRTNTSHVPGQQRGQVQGAATAHRDAKAAAPSEKERQEQLASINREMSEVAVISGLIVATVKQWMTAQTPSGSVPGYPSLGLLNKAWTIDILQSPMALDPVVGSQVLDLLETFLRLRQTALPQQPAARAAGRGESQDEYGDFDFDYDDPALNQLLGLPSEPAPSHGSAAASEQLIADFKAKDTELAELVKAHLSPSMYRLLSNITVARLGQDTGVPEIADREGYIADLVSVWVGCAEVLVQNDMRDWSYYMGEFGKESWYRISDNAARKEIGIHFASGMLVRDAKAYDTFRDQILEILLWALVAPSQHSSVHLLWSRCLNADPRLYLWHRHPIARDELTQDVSIDSEQVDKLRLPFLQVFFRNCKDIAARRFQRPAEALDAGLGDVHTLLNNHKLDKTLIYKLLGSMLTTIRDSLDHLKQQHHQQQQLSSRAPSSNSDQTSSSSSTSSLLLLLRRDLDEYTRFSRSVVLALKHEMGPYYASESALPQLRLFASFTSL